MTVGRAILMLISFKYQSVCKLYLYYDVIYSLVEMLLPRDYGDIQYELLIRRNIMTFILLYF